MKKLAENKIQQDCVVDFTNRYCLEKHNPRCVIYAVPNESQDGREAQKKVNNGLLKGVSDIVVLLPNGKSIYMECKTDSGVQSDPQKKFQDRIENLGFNYYIFRSLSQFYLLLNPHLLIAGLEAYYG
jgi:hypothetical protein